MTRVTSRPIRPNPLMAVGVAAINLLPRHAFLPTKDGAELKHVLNDETLLSIRATTRVKEAFMFGPLVSIQDQNQMNEMIDVNV